MPDYKVIFSFALEDVSPEDLKWWRQMLAKPPLTGRNAWPPSMRDRFAKERGIDEMEIAQWPRFKYRVSRLGPTPSLAFWSSGEGDVGDLVFALFKYRQFKKDESAPYVISWAEVDDIGGASGGAVVVDTDKIHWFCATQLATHRAKMLKAKKAATDVIVPDAV